MPLASNSLLDVLSRELMVPIYANLASKATLLDPLDPIFTLADIARPRFLRFRWWASPQVTDGSPNLCRNLVRESLFP
jgi:hypothetical protein